MTRVDARSVFVTLSQSTETLIQSVEDNCARQPAAVMSHVERALADLRRAKSGLESARTQAMRVGE